MKMEKKGHGSGFFSLFQGFFQGWKNTERDASKLTIVNLFVYNTPTRLTFQRTDIKYKIGTHICWEKKMF